MTAASSSPTSSSLARDFGALFNDPLTSDIKIRIPFLNTQDEEKVEEHVQQDYSHSMTPAVFHLHKIVLASRSDYFYNMFYSEANWQESNQNEIELLTLIDNLPPSPRSMNTSNLGRSSTGSSSSSSGGSSNSSGNAVMSLTYWEQLFRYFYTNHIVIHEENAVELLVKADEYQLDELKSWIEEFLVSKVPVMTSGWSLLFDLAHTYRLPTLSQHCYSFLCNNLQTIVSNEQFYMQTSRQTLLTILKSEHLADEYVLFKMVERWTLTHPEEGDCEELLQYVRLPVLKPIDLITGVKHSPLLRDRSELYVRCLEYKLCPELFLDEVRNRQHYFLPRAAQLKWTLSSPSVSTGPNRVVLEDDSMTAKRVVGNGWDLLVLSDQPIAPGSRVLLRINHTDGDQSGFSLGLVPDHNFSHSNFSGVIGFGLTGSKYHTKSVNTSVVITSGSKIEIVLSAAKDVIEFYVDSVLYAVSEQKLSCFAELYLAAFLFYTNNSISIIGYCSE